MPRKGADDVREVRVASDKVFGSDELTPELVRGATFVEHDGRYDANEVRTFLDRVASSLEVFLSQDAPSALRAEFARNAEIAQQVLDAGQTAAEQLRRQAADDAHRILEETREATERLRGEVEGEISRSREQVEAMRGQFIQDLRDLYDRIGASLYRFERAAEEQHVTPIAEPARATQETPQAPEPPTQPEQPTAVEPEPQAAQPPVAEPEVAPIAPEVPAAHPAVAGTPELPEGAKPPAWQQLPPEAWASTADASAHAEPEPVGGAVDAPQQFAVQEDEPLAPGEPLVDLREFHAIGRGEHESDGGTLPESVGEGLAGSWLDSTDPAGELPPAAPAEQPAVLDETPPSGEVAEGSWLIDEPADIAGASDPALAHDDALAEALIAGTPFSEDDEQPPAEATTPPLPAEPGPLAGASPDSVAVRQLILDSIAAGQSREAIETYLRDHMGFVEPGALVDAALAAPEQP